MAYEEYDGEPDEKEDSTYYPEPEHCDECDAWGSIPNDHASTCSQYETQDLPF